MRAKDKATQAAQIAAQARALMLKVQQQTASMLGLA
jgi:hypothetical protein